MNFKETVGGLLVPDHKLVVGGRFTGQLIREGVVIEEIDDANLVVNEGLNYLLNSSIAGQSPLTSWYIGLFSGNYTPTATVTGATIASASTEFTGYSESTRQPYSTATSTAQQMTNSASPAQFTMSAAGTIYGAFLVSQSAKGGNTGTLLAAAQFSSPKTVASGDLLVLTYTVGATSS
jgi:hypothetical protein